MTNPAINDGLVELAKRCEGAMGPDDDLDRDIALACGWTWLGPLTTDDRPAYRWKAPGPRLHISPPFFTASLDAATAAFPPDTMYRSGHDGAGADPSLFYCEGITAAPDCRRVRSVSLTEPLARVAAALRARSVT